MSLPRFSVNNHVFVNMLMMVVLFGGALFALTLVREMFPESRPDKIGIMALHPGIQPQEIEKAITIKIEDAIHDVEGIEKIDSTVTEGLSITFATLRNEVDDVDSVLQEIKNEVDAIQDLPDDVEQVTIKKLEAKLPVISVALYGDADEATLKRAARDLRDELLLLPGISEIEISGSRDDEISVEIRPERLLEYNITFDEIAETIRQTNLDVSGGALKGERLTVTIRTLGEEMHGRDLEDIVVRSMADGRKVYLSDVAVIRDDFVDTDLESYFNGKPAVNCVVYKAKSQDAIQIASLVKAHVAGKQKLPFDPHGFAAAREKPWYSRPIALLGAQASKSFAALSAGLTGRPDPEQIYEDSLASPFAYNLDLRLHTDLARFIEGRLDLMTRNGKVGLILVLISLNLFLNWRVAFWAAIGLPVSFLGTFIVMWAFGSTINLLTLFGLIIVLGIIVDDAIVIGENIFRHVEEGMSPREAAVAGAEEVMWPVTIAVLTTIAAFAPLLFIRGQIGDFMGQLPIVVLAALSVSLLEALIILPAHLAGLPSKSAMDERSRQRESLGRLQRVMLNYRLMQQQFLHGRLVSVYERFLRFAVRWRYVTVATACTLLMIAAGLFAGGVVPWEFIQKMDSESLICALEMPVGTTSDNVKTRLKTISDFADELPEVANVAMYVARQYDMAGAGSMGTNDQSHLGQLVLELQPADERERRGQRSSEDLLVEFRKLSESLQGVNSVAWESMSGGPGGKDLEIKLTGRRFDDVIAAAESLKGELETYQGVFDLDDDYDRGQREVQLRLRESARPTGITVGMLGSHVRSAMYGRESRRLTRNREDVRIMVRYPESFRENVYNLESMWIPTNFALGDRGWIPLSEVAEISEGESFSSIHRSQQERSVTVFAEVQEGIDPGEVVKQLKTSFEPKLKAGFEDMRMEFLGQAEEQAKAFSGLKLAFPVALLLIYMLLAGLFRSYTQPIVVMSAIPFGFLGAVVGHWVTGYPITILSAIGMVALTGILVNDSLVLVDFINSRVRTGMSEFEASIEGAKLRLRAILLTSLTTIAGLTPLMFETSFQAKFLIPMAVTLTFGLAFATALTLVIVPSLNLIFFDVRNVAGRLGSKTAPIHGAEYVTTQA